MVKKYRLLLTKNSLEALLQVDEADRLLVSSFLTYLTDGNWETPTARQFGQVLVWKQTNDERYLFSCEIKQGCHAIWEVSWTVDLASLLKLPNYMDKEKGYTFSLHILLYSYGNFPGQSNVLMHIKNEDFQKEGEIEQHYLDFNYREPQDEIKYNEELYILAPARIESVLRGEQRGLPLHMTKEQADILSTHRLVRGPILLSGEAGSGKTTVITHWLLINQLEGIQPQLFVTFSDRLTDRTKREFEQKLPPENRPHGVRFLTYRELLWEIANVGGLTLRNEAKEMTFERFLREYSLNIPPQIDRMLLWDEIRSVIKGGCKDPNERFIDYSTYEQLSESRGRCKTPRELREPYYEAAQKYQNYLSKEGLWDSIDLAFDCLRCMDKIQPYARIACDEVQDLTPVEIRVLINLVKDRNIDSIFFTGDTAQVINPSGFLWSRLKGDLGEISKRHDIRDAWVLGRNFRSTTEIVELVNEVIWIRKKILGDTSERSIQDSYVRSNMKPMVLTIDPIKDIQEVISDPGQRLILVKTKEQKTKIKGILGDMWENVTILTVEEAKGLEYEGVLLWNFFVPRHEVITKNDWQNLFIPAKRAAFPKQIERGEKNPYGLAYEFNILHVGLTRARKFLFIFDEDPKMNILNLDETIQEKISKIDDQPFLALWQTTPAIPENLFINASNLMERDREQAFQFFKIAAREFEKVEKFEDAAKSYERASEYSFAASCFEKVGNKAMQEKMLALDSESKEDWGSAGAHWEDYSGYTQDKGEFRESMDGYENSAKAYEKVQMFREAAKSFEHRAECLNKQCEIKYAGIRAESMLESAKLWEKEGEVKEAIRTIERAINIVRDEIIKAEEKVSINGEIPEVWVAICFTLLVDYYEKSENYLNAAQGALSASQFFKTAEKKTDNVGEKETYIEKQCKWVEKSAKLYKDIGQIDTAIDLQKDLLEILNGKKYERQSTQILESLVELLRESERFDEYIDNMSDLIKHLRNIGQMDKAARIINNEKEWLIKKNLFEYTISLLQILEKIYEKDEEYYLKGGIQFEIGNIQDTINERLAAIITLTKAGESFLKLGFLDDALRSFERAEVIAGSEMTPSSIGWLCLKNIAMDLLIKQPASLIEKWVNKAIVYFKREYDQSIERLNEYIAVCEERIRYYHHLYLIKEEEEEKKAVMEYYLVEEEEEKANIDSYSIEEEKMKEEKVEEEVNAMEFLDNRYSLVKDILKDDQRRDFNGIIENYGWTWFCLARLYQKSMNDKEMNEAYDHSIRCFSIIGKHAISSYIKEISQNTQFENEI